MTAIGKALGALTIILLAFGAGSGLSAVNASLDRQSVAMGDTLRLTISATDGEDLDQLDFGPLNEDFEILQRSTSSKTSYVNGAFSSTKEVLLDITPRREGNLSVPAFRLGQAVTSELPVIAAPPPQGTDHDQVLLFEAEVDRSSVYVQGQVILTLRLQQAINLDDRSITELQLDNAFVRPLEQNSFQRTMGGRPWLVHEVRYAIFPEQSGTLTIPAQTFSARESSPRRSLFDTRSSGRQVRRSTEPLIIEVRPRPASYPAGEWLPASELTVQESWSADPEELKVGESATRTITLRGEGLQGAQLPPVLYPATPGIKYYPDQPAISDDESATGLVGIRVDSVAVVPTQQGRWQIPEIRVPWWDTRSNELRYAVLPARELDVAAGSAAAVAPPPPQASATEGVLTQDSGSTITVVSQQGSRTWQIVAIVNGLGWLLTLAWLVWMRVRKPAQVTEPGDGASEPAAFKLLLQACSANDPLKARGALVDWATALTGRTAVTSLAQVSQIFDSEAMNAAVHALNGAMYSTEQSGWDGNVLADSARTERAQYRIAQKAPRDPILQLYPQAS